MAVAAAAAERIKAMSRNPFASVEGDLNAILEKLDGDYVSQISLLEETLRHIHRIGEVLTTRLAIVKRNQKQAEIYAQQDAAGGSVRQVFSEERGVVLRQKKRRRVTTQQPRNRVPLEERLEQQRQIRKELDTEAVQELSQQLLADPPMEEGLLIVAQQITPCGQFNAPAYVNGVLLPSLHNEDRDRLAYQPCGVSFPMLSTMKTEQDIIALIKHHQAWYVRATLRMRFELGFLWQALRERLDEDRSRADQRYKMAMESVGVKEEFVRRCRIIYTTLADVEDLSYCSVPANAILHHAKELKAFFNVPRNKDAIRYACVKHHRSLIRQG